MLTSWWRTKKAKPVEPVEEAPPEQEPIRVGRAAVPGGDEAGYNRDQWTFPFDDLSWTGAEPMAEPPPAFYAFDDAGAPDSEVWRADGWWVTACPSPKLPPPEVSEAGPGAWHLTAEYQPRVVEPKRPRPVVRAMPIPPVLRGSDRIEKLRAMFAVGDAPI